MPKVISRAAVSSSNDAPATASSTALLKTYFCLCGEFLLVIDKPLDKLPRRKFDKSSIVRLKQGALPSQQPRVFKLNVVSGGPKVYIQRGEDNLVEPHHPLACSRCLLSVAYTSSAPYLTSSATTTKKGTAVAGEEGKKPEFLYVRNGAMTEIQGRIPEEAWDGEEGVEKGKAKE